MIDLEVTKKNLLIHLAEIRTLVEVVKMPSFFEVTKMTTSQVKNEDYVRQLAEKLPKSGSHIYYFEVNNPLLLGEYASQERNKDFKYARINSPEVSNYVYIGSCAVTKLGNRFIQHCGWRDKGTYSLQLSKWIGDDELTFTFGYVEIEDKLAIQYIEDQLHRELKPLFGKSGGNNKIKAVK